VEPGRVELPSKRAVARLSTCLFSFRVFDPLLAGNNLRWA
jgi:hypothetical protein